MVIELFHATDPRYLLVSELPDKVTIDDLASWRYGKPLLFAPDPVDAVYPQPGGGGTDWIKPDRLD